MRKIWVIFCLLCSFLSAEEYVGDGMELNDCATSLLSEEAFQTFRASPFCTRVIDTCWPGLGEECLAIIADRHPHLLNHFDEFRKNDSVGAFGSGAHSYGPFGFFCPTTLRYIRIAGEIESLFGSLDDKTVVEIGGGYGGQCRILSSLFSFKEYIIVDVPSVGALAKKYLEALGVTNVRFMLPSEVPNELPCDLLISNYAFSERSNESKIDYIEKILNHSKAGYMVCNDLNSGREHVFKEHFHSDATVEFLPETPRSGGGNYLIVWK